MASLRAFPVVYARSATVSDHAVFWERLGFERFFALPADGEPGYIGLRRQDSEMAVTDWQWPAQQHRFQPPAGPCFEMYVYVDDLDHLLSQLRQDGVVVLSQPADMPWGERVATIADPDGNPVTLCLHGATRSNSDG